MDAIKVEPIFLGYSFATEEPYILLQDETVCADTAKIIINTAPDFQNENDFMDIFYSKLPYSSGCKWEVTSNVRKIRDSITWEYDLNRIKNTLYAQASCFNPDTWRFEFFKLEAHPIYSCPKNSVFYYEGCVTIDPDHCSGDIVGRNMDSKYPIAQKQGHVGLVLRMKIDPEDAIEDEHLQVGEKLPVLVLEVLNNKELINLNTLDDFVNKVPGGYWGEKYGTKSVPLLKNEELLAVLDALYALLDRIEEGATVEYNWSWIINTGGVENLYKYNDKEHVFVKTLYKNKIGFRCDTFLRYLFNQAGIELETGLYITPRKLYSSLLFVRNGQDLPRSSIPYQIAANDADLEKNIEKLFSDKELPGRIDHLTYTYIKSEQIQDDSKVRFLISLIKKHINSEYKTAYILDLLSELKFLDSSTDLMVIYKQTNSGQLRAKIYQLLTKAILFHTKEETEKLTEQDINHILSIQHFLQKNLLYLKFVNAKIPNTKVKKYKELIFKFKKSLKSAHTMSI